MEQPKTPETTSPVDTSDRRIEDHLKKMNLEHLVEAFEERVYQLQEERDQLPETVYYERMQRARTKLVMDILNGYEEACSVSPRFYDNLIYTAMRSRIDVEDGFGSAIERISADVRDINNAHGDVFVTVDTRDVQKLLNFCNKLMQTKIIMSGMGLHVETDRVLATMIAAEYGKGSVEPLQTQSIVDRLNAMSSR